MVLTNKLVLNFPINYLKTVLGNKGKTRDVIQDSTDCTLHITTKKSGSVCCAIIGRRANIEHALGQIKVLIENERRHNPDDDNFQLSLYINRGYGQLLIGTDGKNHRAFQDYFGVRMFLNHLKDDISEVSMTGPLSRLLLAKQGIDFLMQAAENSHGQDINAQQEMFRPYRIMVPEKSIRMLMGKGGANHKKMQANYGVFIAIKNDEREGDMIPVDLTRGSIEKYVNVSKEVHAIIRMTIQGNEGEKKSLDVPMDKVGLVKGKRWATLNKICNDTDTKAYFDKAPQNGYRTLVIVGSRVQVDKAAKKFENLIQKPAKTSKKRAARPIQVHEVAETQRFDLPREVYNQLRSKFSEIERQKSVKIEQEAALDGKVNIIVRGSQRAKHAAIQEMLIVAIHSDAMSHYDEEDDRDLLEELVRAPIPRTPPPPPTFECQVCVETFLLKEGVACTKFNFDDDSVDGEDERHSFCIGCIQNIANASVASRPADETDLARLDKGGIGLPCMGHGCKHTLLLSEIRWYLDAHILDLLEERCMHESIKAAQIDGLVRCDDCTFLLIVETGASFTCPECGRTQCRFPPCTRVYDAQHFGKTCAQVEQEEEQRRLEAIRRAEEARRQAEEAERQAWKRADAEKQARLRAEAEEARRREQNLRDNQMSESAVNRFPRCPNPSCRKPVEKISGCDHMICRPPGGCGKEFCYRCGNPWALQHACR